MFHISKLLNYSMTRVTRGIYAISLLLVKRLLCRVCSCEGLEREMGYILLEKLLCVAKLLLTRLFLFLLMLYPKR